MGARSEIIDKIKEMLGEVTGDSSLAEKLTDATDIINEVGLDSIQMINFVLMMEDEFGIEIDFESFNMENFGSLNALGAFIGEMVDCIAAS